MNGIRQGWLVAKRELRERGRSRAFLASLVVMVIAVVGVIAIPALVTNRNATNDVGMAGTAPAGLTAAITAQGNAVGAKTRIHSYATTTTGERAVRNGTVDVLVVDGKQLEWRRRPNDHLRALVTSAIQVATVRARAGTSGVSEAQLDALLAPITVTNVELGQVAGRSPDDETAAFVMTVLLFMTIATYGAMVLSGVVEEKASRVVEVVLSRVSARSLLAGKVTGIGLLGLGQVVVTAMAALIAATTINGVDLPAVRGTVLAWAVVWFILGYALYATVFGALGSLASRPEDAQSVAGPVSVVLVLVYFVSFAAIGSPDAAWARAVSWIPLAAPISMPSRIAMGSALWWEPVVAAALAAGAIVGLVIVGGRIYASAVLHSGPSLKVREIWTSHSGRHPAARTSNNESRNRTTLVLAAATAVAVGLMAALMTDLVIGVAVGAACFTIIDRAARSWGAGSHR